MVKDILIERFIVLHIDLMNLLLSIEVDNCKRIEFQQFNNIRSKILIISRYCDISEDYMILLEKIESIFWKKAKEDDYIELVDDLSTAFDLFITENYKMNKFVQEHIFESIKLITEYLNTIEFDIENENKYNALLDELSIQSIAIPGEIFAKIKEFVEENIAKYVFNGIDYNIADDDAEILSDGSIHIKSEKALEQLFMGYVIQIEDIKQEFGEFIESTIKPLLIEKGVA